MAEPPHFVQHIKSTALPPRPASQQALASDWRAMDAKGGIFAADPPWCGACLCGVHLNQQGHSPERPLFPSLHHLSVARKPSYPPTGLYEAEGASPTIPPPLQCLFIFSRSHCPHVNAANHTLLFESLSENEEWGNNARLNKHTDN